LWYRSEPFLAKIHDVFRVVVFRVFLFQLILAASVAWGQDASTGALRGVVLDAQGAVVTNADIVAIRVETGLRCHSATDSARRFAVDLLPAGEDPARAEAEGMSPEISPAVRVETSSRDGVDVQAEGGGAEGNDHGVGCAADSGDESEFVIGASG
jgi:hypothetical protein